MIVYWFDRRAPSRGGRGGQDIVDEEGRKALAKALREFFDNAEPPHVHGWRCPSCGSDRWVAASLTGPDYDGTRSIRQCVPCGRYTTSSRH